MVGFGCNLMSSTERTTTHVPSRERSRRILHLIDTGGPGGAETVYVELVRRLAGAGWESIPVIPEVDWLDHALRAEGFDPICMHGGRRFEFDYARRLRSLIRHRAVDLVQTHMLGSSVYGTLACADSSIPVVSTFHGHPDVRTTDRLRALKMRLLSRSNNRVVCVSESLRTHFERSGPFPSGAEVIENGIDTTVFSPGGLDGRVRAELGIAPDAPLLGAVGNVRASKDYPSLLRAFAQVHRAVPASRLVIVGQGSGELQAEVERLRADLGLEGAVHFAGFRDDVADFLRSLDLFVLSSSDEGFSLVTVQAMATGLPVVATRCGGPEQIVGDSGGAVLVPPRDPDALAAALLDVLARPDLGKRLGAAGRARAAEAFSVERMVSRYVELYERCLPEGRSH
ncbi:MAG: glycosyltransferase [Longimicrobiales bacterium]